jgi:hypothetical protein
MRLGSLSDRPFSFFAPMTRMQIHQGVNRTIHRSPREREPIGSEGIQLIGGHFQYIGADCRVVSWIVINGDNRVAFFGPCCSRRLRAAPQIKKRLRGKEHQTSERGRLLSNYGILLSFIELLYYYYYTILYTYYYYYYYTPKRSFKDRVRCGLGVDWVQVSVGLIVFNILLSVWLFRQLVFTVRSVIQDLDQNLGTVVQKLIEGGLGEIEPINPIQQAIGQMLMNSVQNGPAAQAMKGSDGKFTKIIDEVL